MKEKKMACAANLFIMCHKIPKHYNNIIM